MATVFLPGVSMGAITAMIRLAACDLAGKDPGASGAGRCVVARPFAGKDSWANVAIGRILCLGGVDSEGNGRSASSQVDVESERQLPEQRQHGRRLPWSTAETGGFVDRRQLG
jgi:hypothetical protein